MRWYWLAVGIGCLALMGCKRAADSGVKVQPVSTDEQIRAAVLETLTEHFGVEPKALPVGSAAVKTEPAAGWDPPCSVGHLGGTCRDEGNICAHSKELYCSGGGCKQQCTAHACPKGCATSFSCTCALGWCNCPRE